LMAEICLPKSEVYQKWALAHSSSCFYTILK